MRHYHQVGLLPEPERDRSGYRSYDTAAVAPRRLPGGVRRGVQTIDTKLRAEIRRLQGTRKRLARLAAVEHLALPRSVVGYLDRLRGLGVVERYIEMERDAWIMIAAQVPRLVDFVIAKKHEQLDDPDMVKLYSFFRGDLLDSTMVRSSPGAERLVAILEERGWRGWTRVERVSADRLDTGLPPP
ncbi:MerR family transcriptional regulator [Streptomyces massasporeus]|uniref:hypothetical protein n=1 Tax=Streptomyces massasporeus TaxID=67324 RepID=UPI0036A758CE